MRALLALVVWAVVGLTAWHLGANNWFVLGGFASIIAFIRACPNWHIGIVLCVVGLPFLIAGIVNSLLWPAHSLQDMLFLSSSLGAIIGGSLATGYGLLLCGIVSILWGVAVGYRPAKSPIQSGVPFIVGSESSQHSTHTNRVP